MRLFASFFFGLIVAAAPVAAQSGKPLIGVSAPLTGASASLGVQLRDGALVAAKVEAVELAIEDDACTAAGGAAAAQRFVEKKVAIVIGYLCGEAIEAALPILTQAGIPAITVGVRTDSLTDRRDKTKWRVFRLTPRGDAEAAAVARFIPELWRSEPFAIIDDGTIYGRELAETLRASVEQQGLKPVFVDVFRPQLDNQVGLVGRLRKAGASHVFVGGDREDIAITANDAAKLDASIVFAGGEALRGEGSTPLAPGTIMIGLPEWRDEADATVIAAFAADNLMADGYTLPAYAALQIAAAAARQPADGAPIASRIGGTTFNTAIGSIGFDAKGDMTASPYRAYSYDGQRFLPLEEQ